MNEGTTTCYNVSWERSFHLAASLASSIKRDGYVPDLIIAVSRGGLVPARIVADFMLQRELICLRAEHWGVGEKMPERVKITGSTPELRSKKVLVVDDVADSGDTLREITKYLREEGADLVKTAVLHYKKTSTFKPEYWAEEMDEWLWIVYPWSIYEDTTHFIREIIRERPRVETEQIQDLLNRNYKLEIDKRLLTTILTEMRLNGMIHQ
ncbi:MAG: phosphoribosyltransferase [Methanosarcinales archaeon]